jgi:hypothetical protein
MMASTLVEELDAQVCPVLKQQHTPMHFLRTTWHYKQEDHTLLNTNCIKIHVHIYMFKYTKEMSFVVWQFFLINYKLNNLATENKTNFMVWKSSSTVIFIQLVLGSRNTFAHLA